MKRVIQILVVAWMVCGAITTQAQDVNAKLAEAEKAYQAGKLDDARFALQGALAEINKAIGQEILLALPKNLGEMGYIAKDDNTSGVAGIAGVTVSRSYQKDTTLSAKVDILGDSPMLATLNTLLSIPMVMGSGDPNQKRVKIGGYKSLMTKESPENGKPSYSIQVPVNQTLLTFKCVGIEDENAVLGLANSLPIEQIATLSR